MTTASTTTHQLPESFRSTINNVNYSNGDIESTIASINSLDINKVALELYRKTVVDIDDPKTKDIAVDLFKNRRIDEHKRRPRADYMEGVQGHASTINPLLRAHCVEHLVDLSERLECRPETLHLAVNCLDRYMSANKIPGDESAILVAVSCMVIACKYEENQENQYELQVYVHFSHDIFSRDDIIGKECSILKQLKYDLAAPTALSFLERFVRAAQFGGPKKTRGLENMANYIADLSLLSYEMLRFLPSMVAASSVFLAQYILVPSKKPWNATLHHYTEYQPSDLRECVLDLHVLYEMSSSDDKFDLDMIRRKYKQKEYDCVALWISPASPSIPLDFFSNFF